MDARWCSPDGRSYDPPLTYGGWLQSRAVGARIAALLKARELNFRSEACSPDDGGDFAALFAPGSGKVPTMENGAGKHATSEDIPQPKTRRHRLFIHSSPYLRCLQTAIGISAGVVQLSDSGSQGGRLDLDDLGARRPSRRSSTPTIQNGSECYLHYEHDGTLSAVYPKPLLRVDAVLGEWLNKDYYRDFQPPPSPTLMVADAKRELLLPGDFTQITTEPWSTTSANFIGGWGNGADSRAVRDDGPLSRVSSLAGALPRRERSSSHNDTVLSRSRLDDRGRRAIEVQTQVGAKYVPPVSQSAVSLFDAIPPGYVAHARDACIKVDHEWDSTQAPRDWGGYSGSDGEEWSDMHRRCRGALQNMLAWYRDQESKFQVDDKSGGSHNGGGDDNDHEADTVLIIVSHAAPCNALLGALTDSPVLLDIGMASLTLAVSKESLWGLSGAVHSNQLATDTSRRRSSTSDIPVPECYEVKLTASIDHLRRGSTRRPSSSKQSLGSSPSNTIRRQRYDRFGTVDERSDDAGWVVRPNVNAALGSIRRSSRSSSRAPTRPTAALYSHASTGLWCKGLSVQVTHPSKLGANSETIIATQNGARNGELDHIAATPRTNRRGSLWSSGAAKVQPLDAASKRRWTVTDPA